MHWGTGVSLKTQELYAIVFITRYLDLFFAYVSLCALPSGILKYTLVPLTHFTSDAAVCHGHEASTAAAAERVQL